MKIIIAVFLILTITLFLNSCGKEVDDVINEMTLKGTFERGNKTIKEVKDIQKQYAENLKELQEFDNPTNSLKPIKKQE